MRLNTCFANPFRSITWTLMISDIRIWMKLFYDTLDSSLNRFFSVDEWRHIFTYGSEFNFTIIFMIFQIFIRDSWAKIVSVLAFIECSKGHHSLLSITTVMMIDNDYEHAVFNRWVTITWSNQAHTNRYQPIYTHVITESILWRDTLVIKYMHSLSEKIADSMNVSIY